MITNYDIAAMSNKKDHIRGYYNMTVDQLQCLLLCDTNNVDIIQSVIADRQQLNHSNTKPQHILIADDGIVYHPGDHLILDNGQKFQQGCVLVHSDVINEYSDVITDRGQQLWVANYRLERKFIQYKNNKNHKSKNE